MLFEIFRRVEVIGQRHGGKLDARMPGFGGHRRIDELQRAIGSALACGIAIEQVNDAVARMAREHADMLARERGAQCSHDVFDAVLVHGDDVGVALANDRRPRRGHRRLRLVEREQHAPFMEQRRLLGVEVFRLALADHATAEGDAAAGFVVDGEHHAIEESVPQMPIAACEGDVRLDHLVRLEALRRQVAHQSPAPRGEPEPPGFRHLPAKSAARKVRSRCGGLRRFRAHELGMVELGRLLAHRHQARTAALPQVLSLALAVVGDLDVGSLGQAMHRFGEGQVLHLHDIGEHVPAFPATEAMERLPDRVDLARRGFLVMERAAHPEIAALLLERGTLPHQGDQIVCLADFLLIFLGEGHAGCS